MKRQQQPNTRARGFSLVELMIVIAIIGVLAAIAVPNFKAAREKANTKACWANQKTLAGALEMYNLDNNAQLAKVDQTTCTELKNGGYIQDIPQDPGGEGQWNYEMDDKGNLKCKKHGAIGTRTGQNAQGGAAPTGQS